MRYPVGRTAKFLLGLAFPALLLAAWELASRNGGVNPVFVPPPSAIAVTVANLVVTGRIIGPLLHTVSLLAAGYTIGCTVAIATGVLMGSSRRVFNLLEPLTELLRPIPKVTLLPVLALFLGLGSALEVTLIALSSFFPVLINTVQGVRGVDPTIINVARTFGHSPRAIWWRIMFPAAAPFILAGMRISLGIALVVVVLSEMLSGTGGLGDMVLRAQRSFVAKESYAWVVILAILGLCLTALFSWTERHLAFWSAPQTK